MKNRRHIFQAVAAVAQNAYVHGFFKGEIFNGKTKLVCVPGLNCYSCPGALGACPMGSLQAALGSPMGEFPFYVVGLLVLFAGLLGRFVCGFLCLFGFVQDLLYKIKLPKLTVPAKLDRILRYLKYVVLAVLVIALPLFLRNDFGLSSPYYCKWLCPAGTLEAGIPLLIANPELRAGIGSLFFVKLGILILILLASLFIYRPFCKYLCPLGAFYGLFNGVSLYRMELDRDKCVNCGLCERACKMKVQVTRCINSPECIRCGDCKRVCPHNAISAGFKLGKAKGKRKQQAK